MLYDIHFLRYQLGTAQELPNSVLRMGNLSIIFFLEQKVLCAVSTFCKSIFVWFACHYIFNLEYDKRVKEVALFFQEYVFGEPANCKKHPHTCPLLRIFRHLL